MNKRTSLLLACAPVALLGLLLFLSRSVSVSGEGVAKRAYAVPEALLLQGASEVEPNDTITTANAIDVNLTMGGAIPVAQPSDIDWYRLILSSADLGREFRASVEEDVPDADYKLELNLYNAEGSLVTSASSGSFTSLNWTASVTTYYLRVRAVEFDTVNAPGDANYDLDVIRLAADATPTYTATPVPWDACEINDTIDGAWPGGPCLLSVGLETGNLNFVQATGQPTPNPDYFTFLAKTGHTYRITTMVDGGTDTEMWLYDPTNVELAYDDDGGAGSGSRIERSVGAGWHKILVRDRLGLVSPPTSQTYDILVEDITPGTSTPTATPVPGDATNTPQPPSIPGAPDPYEPNYDFGRATLIGLDTEYRNLNFVPWVGTNPDNDFFKLWVVAGKLYTCETYDLGAATNTNMILYSGPGQEYGFAGNDDVEPFDPADPYRSRITFFSSYNGYVYILLGQVGADQILPGEWKNLSYVLRCYIDQPGTATPTPTSQFAPPTPQPTPVPAQNTPLPSPTLVQLVVLPMTTPTPPSAAMPAATPTPELAVIELSLYYDRNGNAQMEPGEGIVDVLARAFDAITGDLLSIDYTDEMGRLRFTVPDRGPVRVSVPFFGFGQIVTASNTSIQIRISPRP